MICPCSSSDRSAASIRLSAEKSLRKLTAKNNSCESWFTRWGSTKGMRSKISLASPSASGESPAFSCRSISKNSSFSTMVKGPTVIFPRTPSSPTMGDTKQVSPMGQ